EIYLREALEGGYISTFLFVDGTKAPGMFEALGWDSFEGFHGTAPGSELTDAKKAFDRDYAAAFAVEVPNLPFIAETYDAVILIALASEKAGTTTDSTKIRNALREIANTPGEVVGPGLDSLTRALQLIREGRDINYVGAAGAQDFDENGDVISTIEIWKVEGGEVVSTGRFELP
ncbi:MAG: amino acid ABC transporter substrate-binding protein, partial [Dehalococcoidia bacterium]|nr:amino acid ABC transporter substrate-binding protein [Dehalococcoidia bacterium]